MKRTLWHEEGPRSPEAIARDQIKDRAYREAERAARRYFQSQAFTIADLRGALETAEELLNELGPAITETEKRIGSKLEPTLETTLRGMYRSYYAWHARAHVIDDLLLERLSGGPQEQSIHHGRAMQMGRHLATKGRENWLTRFSTKNDLWKYFAGLWPGDSVGWSAFRTTAAKTGCEVVPGRSGVDGAGLPETIDALIEYARVHG